MKYRMLKKKDLSWMKGSLGASSHYTSYSIMEDGTKLPFAEGVERFDVESFADALADMGVRHYLLTLTHAEQYLPMPNAKLDSILPGRTCRRDLVAELIAALKKRGIRFMVYYNHSCNGDDDVPWKTACGYAAGGESLDTFADNICGIVEEISKRYGDGISAWWFDSSYSVDPRGPQNTISCDMGGWQFPWDKLADAVESWNPNAAIAFNAGIDCRFQYSDRSDYYAGEAADLDYDFTELANGLIDTRWTCIDSMKWTLHELTDGRAFIPTRFGDEELARYTYAHLDAGQMVTYNILTDQSGKLNPYAVEQLKRIKR